MSNEAPENGGIYGGITWSMSGYKIVLNEEKFQLNSISEALQEALSIQDLPTNVKKILQNAMQIVESDEAQNWVDLFKESCNLFFEAQIHLRKMSYDLHIRLSNPYVKNSIETIWLDTFVNQYAIVSSYQTLIEKGGNPEWLGQMLLLSLISIFRIKDNNDEHNKILQKNFLYRAALFAGLDIVSILNKTNLDNYLDDIGDIINKINEDCKNTDFIEVLMRARDLELIADQISNLLSR